MKTSLLKTTLFAAAAVVGATGASALELVTNGGFESGTALGANSYLYNGDGAKTDSWPEYGTGRQNGSSVWAPSAYQGSYVIWFQGNVGDAAQVLDFPVPGTYRLSFAYAPRNDGLGAFPHYRAVRVGANVLCYYDVAKDGAWHTVTKDFVVSAPGPQELRFYQYKWNGDCGSSIDAVSCTLLTPAEAVTDCSSWRQVRAVLEAGGSVRLTKDVQHDGVQTGVSGKTATVDLNGHTIYALKSDTRERVFYSVNSGNLTITDSVGGGAIDGQGSSCKWYGSCLSVEGTSATLTIDGNVTIRNFNNTNDSGGECDRGAIYVYGGCTFNFKSGTIANCVSAAGGGAIWNGGTVNITGGAIVNCGGANNGNGGGIYNNGGTVNMNGGLIAGCAASDRGGAIHNQSGVTHIHGVISNCTARCAGGVSGSGGTVYLYDDGAIVTNFCSHATQTTFDGPGALFDGGHFVMYGGRICDNYGASARGFTGLVMWSAGNTFTMYGGVISNNTTASSGVAVKQVGVYSGTVSLRGGLVEQEPTAANIQGYNGSVSVASYAKVGDWYVVGSPIATDTDKTALTGGSFTFCPTNDLYAAAGLRVADGAVTTGSGQTWTLASTNAVPCGDWATVNANLCAGNDVILASDMTQTFMINPNHAKSVTIDLNGHTVSAGVDNARFFLVNNWYLTIRGEGVFDGIGHSCNEGHFAVVGYGSSASGLTIEDGVTVRNMTAQLGAAYRVYSGSLTFNGGTVSNCVATTENGGAVYTAGTFTMNGGTIVGCSASTGGSGGAIFAANGGNAYIYGGSLCDNSSRYYGGAIYGQSTSTVAVYGGYFRGNRTQQANGGQFLCIDNWVQNGNVYGGVFDGYDPQTYGTDDARAIKLQNAKTKIGDLYVIGNNPRLDGSAITGGQYTFALTNAEYAATGLYDAEKATVTGSGTAWGVKTAEPVGASDWATLKAALLQGCDVTLVKDIDTDAESVYLQGAQNVTLDLNGHCLRRVYSDRLFIVHSSTVMTIKDSVGTGKVCANGTGYGWGGALAHVHKAHLVIESGMFDGLTSSCTSQGGGCVCVADGGTLTMNGGTIKNGSSAYAGGAVCVEAGGTFTMHGGTISGCSSSAVYSAGSVVITGGTITGCSGSNGGAVYCTGPAWIYGGTIENCTASGCGGAIYDGGASIVRVYGGTFKGNKANYGGVFASAGSCWFDIFGGVFVGNTATTWGAFFDDASANRYCYVYGGEWANGYNPIGSDDTQLISGRTGALVGSTYVIGLTGFTSHEGELVGGSFNFAVTNAEYAANGAKVFAGSTLSGSDTSFTLAPNEGAGVDAGDWATVKSALQAGVSVTLTNDVASANSVASLKTARDVTLDLNGHSVQRVGNVRLFELFGGTLTIRDSVGDGRFYADATKYIYRGGFAILVQGAAQLILDGGTIDGFSANGEVATYDEGAGGAVEVCSDTTFVMNGGAIRNCQAKTSGGAVHVLSGGTFTMNGGTISGCSVTWSSADDYAHGGGAIYNAGTVTINGGSLVDNHTYSYACGGVFFNTGTVTVNGGSIKNNGSAHCSCVNYKGTFIVTGGEIASNTGKYNVIEGLAKVSGGYFHDNVSTATDRGMYNLLTGSYFSGGVFDSACKPASNLSDGSVCTQVGSNYVIGKGVLADGATLTEGLYTFNPTNAEYAAAGVKVAETPVAQGTSPETWAIAAKKYCVCGDPACPGESAGEEHEIRTWHAWTSTTTLPAAAGNWYLAGDVNLSGQYSPVNGVTIDLAGRTIRQTATNARVINLNANVTFTLTDSVGGGKVTGGNIAGQEDVANNGGCVFMNVAGSQFVMYGGSICGNKALTGGGIYCNVASSVKVYGGAIEGNTAEKWGGGMCLSRGAHTLRNCIIRNNTAQEYWGGAVRIDYGTVTFVDCAITNNTAANWPGISANVTASPVVTLGGATVVRDNHLIGQTAQNNLGVESGYTYSLSTDEPLTAGAEIGVTSAAGAAIVTTPNDGDYTALFFADNAAYAVVNDANQVRLVSTNSVVATIGETRYSSLQYALNSAEPGDTVTLVRNTAESVVADSYTDATLDLNGFVLKASGGSALSLNAGASLVLTNGDETVTHYFTVGTDGLWAWNDGNATGAIDYETLTARPAANAVIAVKGGCVTGGNGVYRGGGVYQEMWGRTRFVLAGGSIVGNLSSYGAVYLGQAAGCDFLQSGGRICGNRTTVYGGGVFSDGGGSITLEGGDISFNTAPNGGGIFSYRDLVMNGGKVYCNTASEAGGGVYCNGALTMTGGTISNCTATSYGGAVYVTGAFTLNGGVISGCETTKYDANVAYGGAVAVASGGTFTMNAGELINNRSGAESPNYGWGSAVNVASGGMSKIYGGVITNNTSFGNGPIRADGTSLVYGGVIKGNRWYWDTGTYKVGTVCGGVFDRSDVQTVQAGCMIEQVGDNWVVGADVAQEEGKLTGGTYTFNPANAEYAAANVAVAPWVDVTTDETGDPQTWTLADGTSPVDAGETAKARIKDDGTCWITGSGETAETEALAAQWANVRDVRIASGVTGVGSYSFYKFSNLTNVTVSASCTRLGEGAFFRCLALEQVTFEGEVPEMDENALNVHAGIRMEGDTPVVYAVPNVTVNGKDMTLKGKDRLEDAEWQTVAPGEEGKYHFFRFVAGE